MSQKEATSSVEPSIEEKLNQLPPIPKVRIRFSLYGVGLGFLIFLLGAKPSLFGLDRSPVVGFVQIAVMLIGLAIICLSGYIAIHSLWRKQTPSITADIGWRLVATGYVIALFSGMADVLALVPTPCQEYHSSVSGRRAAWRLALVLSRLGSS
jgi:disulfide bond formation protein DsbB